MNRRWLSGAAGLSLTLYPGALAVFAIRLLFQRQVPRFPVWGLLVAGGALWLAPAIADAVRGRWSPQLLGEVGQLVWWILAFLGGLVVGARLRGHSWLLRGLMTGIAVMAGASVVLGLTSQGRVSGWLAHPNIWASAVLLPVTAVLLMSKSAIDRLIVTSLAILVVTLSGSRAISLVLLAVILFFAFEAAFRRLRSLRARLTAVVSVVALLVGVYAGMALVQPRFVESITDLLTLRIAGLEAPLLGGAQALGVKVSQESAGVTRIESTDSNWWSRLQYPMLLFPDRTYSMRLELGTATSGASPGVVGVVAGEDRLVIGGADGWAARGEGSINVVDFRVEEAPDGWTEVAVSFRSEDKKVARMWIGPAPNLAAESAGAAILVRGLVAVVGDLSALRAEGCTKEISPSTIEALARVSSFAAGWRGFVEAPMFGQRDRQFSNYYRENPPTQDTAVPPHAHNVIIQVLYEMGFTGAFGLVLILLWLGRVLFRSRVGPRSLVLVIAALAANMFDFTFWAAGALLFLFAFAGIVTANMRSELLGPGRT